MVIGLRRSADMGEVAGEEQSKLRQDRPAQRQHALLAALPVDAERAAMGVKVANLDPCEFAPTDAEQNQAEQRQAVTRTLGDRKQSRAGVGRQKRSDALLGARAPDP
ncbi:MAG TPA: hypothetical protein VLK36_01435, partial [Gaiellaceae bacterium]|nr:hypothetical protein [Gaiellaceae bacterium]